MAVEEQGIPFVYQFSQADFLALAAALGRPAKQQILRLLLLWVGVVAVISIVLACSAGAFPAGLLDFVSLRTEPAIIYPIMALGLVLVLLAPVVNHIQVRQAYKHALSAGQSISGTLDAAGIHTAMEGLQSHLAWSIIQHAIITDAHLFLVFNKTEALVIPKHAFESQQALGKAETLVRSKVPAR